MLAERPQQQHALGAAHCGIEVLVLLGLLGGRLQRVDAQRLPAFAQGLHPIGQRLVGREVQGAQQFEFRPGGRQRQARVQVVRHVGGHAHGAVIGVDQLAGLAPQAVQSLPQAVQRLGGFGVGPQQMRQAGAGLRAFQQQQRQQRRIVPLQGPGLRFVHPHDRLTQKTKPQRGACLHLHTSLVLMDQE
jgi:hypothetical protein